MYSQFKERGQDIVIYPKANVVAQCNLSLGDNIIIDDFVFIYSGVGSKIGSFVHLASFVLVTGGGEFTIDDFAAVSSHSAIFTGNDDYSGGGLTNPTVPSEYRNVKRSYVRIGKHALVGAKATILPGVTIGEGARVGAHSLVTQDIPPWQLWAGTPARFIKNVPKETILQMEGDLRKRYYRQDGAYIPRTEWEKIKPRDEAQS